MPALPVLKDRSFDLIVPVAATTNWPPLLTACWMIGFLTVCGIWLARWRKLRIILRAARDSDIAAPLCVKITPVQLEPGLVGVFRPVLLLPEGIAEKLAPAEFQSIIAHEACHLSRRDNLTAALHMLVEACFWFWPPVWWLGTRLVAEREKACDEAVLAAGSDPQVYAESILKVCKHYVSSPLACAAGVSGADLKQRMEDIMRNHVIAHLNISKKVLLAASAALLLVLPLAAGIFAPPADAQTAEETTSSASIITEAMARVLGPPPAGLADACNLTPQSRQPELSRAPFNAQPILSTHTPPPYPATSQSRGDQGTVVLTVLIGADGKASDAVVNQSSGNKDLDGCAAAWVKRQWHWQPEVQNGKPVVSKSLVTAHFRLVPATP